MTVTPGRADNRPGVDVCLVTMPYSSILRPSLALGLLKTALRRAGLTCAVRYPNLTFEAEVGVTAYLLCSHLVPTEFLAGEWTFAATAFPDAVIDDEAFLDHVTMANYLVLGYRSDEGAARLRAELLRLRAAAAGFVDRTAAEILRLQPRIVGCTSTFQQHVPSLALLRRIKEASPGIVTMLGGANCEAEMGAATHALFPWVDYVVSGDADELLPGLCRSILDDAGDVPRAPLPFGVLSPSARVPTMSAAGQRDRWAERAAVTHLDALPIPDFTDYFDALHESTLAGVVTPGLPLETSRGCWWGASHQCTFCGLNGAGMAFRSKSPDRVLAEMGELRATYGIDAFEVVDNILDMRYFRTLLPRLADEPAPARLFYEIKSNLTRLQVAQLRAAGVTWVQPGIESLSSEVLRLMNKGVDARQNLQLLRWCRQYGIRVSWNILAEFPGEDDTSYVEMARLLPLLEHLQPPHAVIRVRFDRFGVYHAQPDVYGLRLRATPAARYVYPHIGDAVEDLAYFFVAEGQHDAFSGGRVDRVEGRPGLQATRAAVKGWYDAFHAPLPPVLSEHDDGTVLELLDTRRCMTKLRHRLDGLDRAVYRACDDAPRPEHLPGVLDPPYDRVTVDRAAEAAARLLDDRIVARVDGRLVALGVPGDLPALPSDADFPGGSFRHRTRARIASSDVALRAKAAAGSDTT